MRWDVDWKFPFCLLGFERTYNTAIKAFKKVDIYVFPFKKDIRNPIIHILIKCFWLIWLTAVAQLFFLFLMSYKCQTLGVQSN